MIERSPPVSEKTLFTVSMVLPETMRTRTDTYEIGYIYQLATGKQCGLCELMPTAILLNVDEWLCLRSRSIDSRHTTKGGRRILIIMHSIVAHTRHGGIECYYNRHGIHSGTRSGARSMVFTLAHAQATCTLLLSLLK